MNPPAAGAAAEAAGAPSPRRAAGAGRPRLALAGSERQRRSAASVLGSVLLVLVFLSVLGVVVFQALLVQTQSRIDDLETQIVAEERRARDLRLELAELRSPERIVSAARDRLGMIPPGEVLYLQHDEADAAVLEAPPAEAPTPDGGAG